MRRRSQTFLKTCITTFPNSFTNSFTTTFTKTFFGCVLASMTLLGCDSPEPTTPVVRDASQLYAAVRLNHKAIMLSLYPPYDTVQLRVVPISLTGDTLPYDGTVEFVRLNILDTSIHVDSTTGFVQAHTSTNSTRVIARLTIGGVTRADTATIMIRTETPARRVSRVEFAPPATDSNWRWASDTRAVSLTSWIRLFDLHDSVMTSSQTITHVAVEKPSVFSSEGGSSGAWAALSGESWLYVRTYAYGTSFIDSVLFRRVDPPVRFVVVDRVVPAQGPESIAFYPGTVTAKAGSTIVFVNRFGAVNPLQGISLALFLSSCGSNCGNRIPRTIEYPSSTLIWVDSVDVVFDDPDQAQPGSAYGSFPYPTGTAALIADGTAGDIPAFAVLFCTGFGAPNDCGGRGVGALDRGYRTRRFDTPGTYHYSSSRYPGARGTIIITE